MNKPTRTPKASEVKITKKQVDAALAAGNTHAKFQNKGVQKRLMKNQAKIKRQQDLRDNAARRSRKIVAGVIQNVAKSGAVVDQGVAALSQLVDAKADAAIKALIDPASPDVRDAVLSIRGESKDGQDDIDPASIGGDLIDVDYEPHNFGVQAVSQEVNAGDVTVGEDGILLPRDPFPVLKDKDGLIYVKLFSKEELTVNRAMLNLYGDAQNYKPLPAVGDKVPAHGVAIAIRDFGMDHIPVECDLTALTEINYVFDRLRFAPTGEVVTITDTEIGIKPDDAAMQRMASGAVHVTSADIMNDDVKRSYPHVIEPMTHEHLNAFEAPHDSARKQMFGTSLEAAMQARPESFTDVPVKIQNSGISGAHLNPLQNIVHSTADRPDHVYDPLLSVPQPLVPTDTQMPQTELDDAEARIAETRRTEEEEDKDRGADDTSFSLKP